MIPRYEIGKKSCFSSFVSHFNEFTQTDWVFKWYPNGSENNSVTQENNDKSLFVLHFINASFGIKSMVIKCMVVCNELQIEDCETKTCNNPDFEMSMTMNHHLANTNPFVDKYETLHFKVSIEIQSIERGLLIILCLCIFLFLLTRGFKCFSNVFHIFTWVHAVCDCEISN